MSRLRLDELIVARGLVSSLDEAQRLILAGHMREARSGRVLDKPGVRVSEDLDLHFVREERFVSRGGEKLDAFLQEAGIHFKNQVVLDVGSSTGGFMDCALQSGADFVYGVDTGTHQLHEKLRAHPQVQVFEQTDIRYFDFSCLKRQVHWVTVDVSFISLRLIVPVLLRHFPSARFIFLFKPQFELDRRIPKKRGVAPDREGLKSLEEMLLFLKELGLNPRMSRPSALKGTKGNQEYFIMADSEIPSGIFRTYDIRGLAERDLSSSTVKRIGRAFGKRVLAKFGAKAQVGVGRDARTSSPRIYGALASGLLESGVGVLDLGFIPTPMAYFAHFHFPIQALMQITASHNPKDDNGMKMMFGKETLFGADISSLADEARREPSDATILNLEAVPQVFEELKATYLSFLHREFKFKKKFRIVLDCGNGMIGAVAREAFSPYADDLEILYEKVDCTFPNHEADPTIPANLQDICSKVRSLNADAGFAFDGDGDRLGVISPKGRILWGDEILMLLADLVLKERPGSTIIGEVKCSEKLFRAIKEKGGQPMMYRTGHSLIKKKMKEVGAPIAGEMSGHLFFGDRYFGYDDAVYGALRVLEVMDQLNLNLDTWVESHPASYVTPEIRVECAEEEKARLVEQVKRYFEKMPQVELNLIDGVRVGFSDSSWALVRASNTQAVLVVRVEGTSASRLEEIKAMMTEALGRSLQA